MPRPPLTQEQQALAAKNIKLARAFVHQHRYQWYVTRINSFEDAEACAMFALCEAARSFDESRGTKFSTIAYLAMKRRLMKEASRCDLIRTPAGGTTTPKIVDNFESVHSALLPTTVDANIDEHEETKARVKSIKESLLPHERVLVLDFYCFNTPQKETAKLLRMTRQSARIHRKKIIDRIREEHSPNPA